MEDVWKSCLLKFLVTMKFSAKYTQHWRSLSQFFRIQASVQCQIGTKRSSILCRSHLVDWDGPWASQREFLIGVKLTKFRWGPPKVWEQWECAEISLKNLRGDGDIQKFQKDCFAILVDSFPCRENVQNSLFLQFLLTAFAICFFFLLLPIAYRCQYVGIFEYICAYIGFYKIYIL